MTKPKSLPHSPYLPFDPQIAMYNASFGHLQPWEFNGWKLETLSWKDGVYLHAGLNPPMPYRLTGPGALQLLKDACINGFGKFSIGCSKHAVMCNDQGNVMSDGMVLRLGDEEFLTYYLSPYIDFLVASGRYDVKGKDLSGKTFLFQIAGPRSLAVMEKLISESLRDLEFLWHRPAKIHQSGLLKADIEIRVYRLGVARTLAYEIHGDIGDAEAAYDAIMEVGAEFGIERLGLQAYGMNHTEGGFAQSFIHFLPAWTEDQAFIDFLGESYAPMVERLPGSAGPNITKRYANPVELGWGHMIKFDHPFKGREALKEIMAKPRRTIVTLEWRDDDIVDLYASQFRQGQYVQFMDFPANPIWQGNISTVFCDDVLIDDALIGISSGRIFSYYYKKMISLGVLDIEHAVVGNEVEVLWGDPGSRQVRLRATIGRYPYLDLPFNRDINVADLPPTA